MKKFIAMMMIASIFAGILAGCGSKEPAAGDAPAETAGAATAGDAKPAGETGE